MRTLGQIAYEAYRNCSNGKSLVSGAPIPTWENLSAEIRAAWELAAFAVKQEAEKRQPRPRNGIG